MQILRCLFKLSLLTITSLLLLKGSELLNKAIPQVLLSLLPLTNLRDDQDAGNLSVAVALSLQIPDSLTGFLSQGLSRELLKFPFPLLPS